MFPGRFTCRAVEGAGYAFASQNVQSSMDVLALPANLDSITVIL